MLFDVKLPEENLKKIEVLLNCMWKLFLKLVHLTFTGPCIVIYPYNKIQQDALFLNFTLVNNSTCFGQTYCPIIRSLHTVFTATGICHTSYVDCLLPAICYISTSLADSQHN